MILKNRIAHFMKAKGYNVIVSYTKEMPCVKYPHPYPNEKYSMPKQNQSEFVMSTNISSVLLVVCFDTSFKYTKYFL